MNELWELLVVLNPVLAGAIITVTEIVKLRWSNYPRWATIVVGIALTAVYYFIADGPTIIQLVVPLLTAVFAYDFTIGAIRDKQPPIGGGGGGPKRYQ